MCRSILVLVVLLLFTFSACSGMKFRVFGIDVNETRTVSNYSEFALGIVGSFVTHVAGHYLAAEIFDVDIHQQGLNEIIDYSNDPSENNVKWVARGGFILQLAVNTALVELANESYFTRGYTAFTSIELLTYNIRHKKDGDFNLIEENGGNRQFEYFLYTGWATYNFCRISIHKKHIKEKDWLYNKDRKIKDIKGFLGDK